MRAEQGGGPEPAHLTAPAVAQADRLPAWATMVRAPNPGPMTLDGTNTWLLRLPGSGGLLVVDPGPLDEGHLRAVAEHGPVAGILTTHGHPDHVAGLARFQRLTGAEVLDDAPGVERIDTPGHTRDSRSFLVSDGTDRGVLTGDTILGRGTAVVAYPDGDLGQYLDSLARLAGLGAIPVLPGHGPALSDCAAAAAFYLAHRQARLAQVRRVRDAGTEDPARIVEIVYADVDRSVWPAAELSVRAQLAHLARSEGRETRADPEQYPGNVPLDTP